MAVMLRKLHVKMTWREVFTRTFKEAYSDNCLGMAAQLAYYFFLALFPALLFVLAIASYFPLEKLVDSIITMLGGFAPPDVLHIITDQVRKISEGQNGGLLTIGFLGAVWSSSSAMTAIVDTLNTAYGIKESRPWWEVRVISVLLTLGVAVFILVSFALVLAGPLTAEALATRVGLGPVFKWTWLILQWPVVFGLVAGAVALIYYFAPDAEQEWVWLTPGSVFATLLWLGGSLGFKYYVANFGDYNATYGTIGGVVVLMLWFYLTGLVILVGAEMNAEIEHASPYGKDEGEKVPGEKKRIGVARMRAWLAAHGGWGAAAPGDPMAAARAINNAATEAARPGASARPAPEVPLPVGTAGREPIPVSRALVRRRPRVSDFLIGGVALLAGTALAARRRSRQVSTFPTAAAIALARRSFKKRQRA